MWNMSMDDLKISVNPSIYLYDFLCHTESFLCHNDRERERERKRKRERERREKERERERGRKREREREREGESCGILAHSRKLTVLTWHSEKVSICSVFVVFLFNCSCLYPYVFHSRKERHRLLFILTLQVKEIKFQEHATLPQYWQPNRRLFAKIQ